MAETRTSQRYLAGENKRSVSGDAKEKESRVTSRFLACTTGWMVAFTGAENLRPNQ